MRTSATFVPWPEGELPTAVLHGGNGYINIVEGPCRLARLLVAAFLCFFFMHDVHLRVFPCSSWKFSFFMRVLEAD